MISPRTEQDWGRQTPKWAQLLGSTLSWTLSATTAELIQFCQSSPEPWARAICRQRFQNSSWNLPTILKSVHTSFKLSKPFLHRNSPHPFPNLWNCTWNLPEASTTFPNLRKLSETLKLWNLNSEYFPSPRSVQNWVLESSRTLAAVLSCPRPWGQSSGAPKIHTTYACIMYQCLVPQNH